MFCRKCGTKNEDSDIFCAECGARLMPLPNNNVSPNESVSPVVIDSNNNVSNGDQLHNMEPRVNPTVAGASARIQAAQTQSQPYAPQPTAAYGNGSTSKKFPIIPIVICALLALCAIGAGVFWFANRNTINLDKYVVIETSGYNGYGSCDIKIDYDAIDKKYGKKLKYKNEGDTLVQLNKLYNGSPIDFIDTNTTISKSGNCYGSLSNGDKVTYKIEANSEKISEYLKCKVKYSDEDVEVEIKDLEEAEEFDAFSGDILDIRFEGISPNGSVVINNLQYQDELEFSLSDESYEENGNLRNGDEVTICVETDYIEDFIEKYGLKPSVTERTYTVDGLSEYITDAASIPDETLNKMVNQGEDAFRAYVADDWEKPKNLRDISYVGNYMLSLKDGMEGDSHNYIYMIYKIKALNPDPKRVITFYYYARYNDIIIDSNGECDVDISDYSVPVTGSWFDNEDFSVGDYTYAGYESLDELFNNCVENKRDAYDYTDNVE